MTLKVVDEPDRPSCAGCRERDIVEVHLRREVNSQQLKLNEQTTWVEAWTQVIDDIGDLLHTVKERPKGRRFATVLDLRNLLLRQHDMRSNAEGT